MYYILDIFIYIYIIYIYNIYYIFSKSSWTNLSNKVIDKLLDNILHY